MKPRNRRAIWRAEDRPPNNTTCDVYFSPNVPPASADVSGIACALLPDFATGARNSAGDSVFRWTHVLYTDAAIDIRDSYPNAPSHRVYVPDKTGTGFDVFVELVNRGTAQAFRRVYLDRRAPTWPTASNL